MGDPILKWKITANIAVTVLAHLITSNTLGVQETRLSRPSRNL